MAFVEVSETNQLNELFGESNEKPVILFKHSLTCPISHAAYEEMSLLKEEPVFLIVVQDARRLSNEIAARTNVKHESPQTLILHNNSVVWHASHYDITKAAVMRGLEELKQ